MEDAIGPLFQLLVPLILLGLGLTVGRATERRHLRNLDERERRIAGMLITDLREYSPHLEPESGSSLVMGEVVIATDYLKTFLANLRKIVGGRLNSYQILLIRARREALLRMIEDTQRKGYNAICNVRLDTADIGSQMGKKATAMVEVLASGTAYRVSSDAPKAPPLPAYIVR